MSDPERQCRAAFDAARWIEAATACEQALLPGRPELLILVARSWDHNNEPDKVLAAAERAFGTIVDASARQLAGIVYEEREDHTAAQVLLTVALVGHVGLGDHVEAARDAHALTGVLLHRRRLTDALDAARLCIREAERGGDLRLIGFGQLAQADVLTTLGDAPAARAAFVAASSILGAWPRDVAWVLVKHGMFVLELEDSAAAVDLLGNALAVAEPNGVAEVVTAAHLNLAVAEQMRGNADAAQHHLAAVPATARATSSAEYVEAKLAADRGDLTGAAHLYEIAAEHPSNDDYAWQIASQRGALAERAGTLVAAEDFYRAAIAIVETIRKRTAARELRPWLLARRREPYEALFALLATQHRDLEALEVAEQLHARTWLDAVVEQAAPRARSMLYEATVVAPPLAGHDLLAALGKREVLVYVTARGVLWRVHIAADHRVALARLPDDVRQLLLAWRDHPGDPAIAERLGALLIPNSVTTSERPLYIVASELLADLPFAALRRSHRLLINDRPVVRLPGIAALRCRSIPSATDDEILLGDVRGDLPRARAEVESVALAVHGHAYVGSAATLARAVSSRRARLFHAAVHAGVDAVGGGLELADGRLTGADIIGLGISPEIAVLAGCNTGGSRDNEGWGGLPSALLVAGTRSVVATLRPVLDEEAAAVIRTFYRAGGARHPAHALQFAQQALAREGAEQGWMWFAAWGLAEPDECDARPAPL